MPDRIDADDVAKIGVREFRAKFAGFMRQVQAGQSLLVTSHEKVIAEVRPPPDVRRAPRQLGALRGRIHMPADFDVLPEDVLAAMEGTE